MADNVAITAGAGTSIATDDVSGVQYQRVKIALGADGAAADVAPGQTTMAASLPVVIASNQSAIAVSGTVTASGPLTDAQLRASAVPVSAGTNLNTSALALESGGNLATLVARVPVLGSAVSASSIPVVVASDQAAINVLTADAFVTGQGSQTALNNNIVLASAGAAAYDSANYKSVGLQIVVAAGTVTAGNITFEASNDNANFQAVPLYDVASLTANPVTTYALAAATNRYFRGPMSFRYFRARISTGVTGTTTGIQCFSRFSPESFTSPQQTITQATAANLLATVSATNLSCNVAQINAVTPLMGNGVTGTGSLRVTIASDTTANTNAYNTQRPTPTESFINSAATTNATSVKASAGTIFALTASNTHATVVAYVKLYNKASAPTVGTDVPVIVLQVPAAGGRVECDCGSYGHRFGTGIALAITAAAADSDTTAVGANDVKVATSYV